MVGGSMRTERVRATQRQRPEKGAPVSSLAVCAGLRAVPSLPSWPSLWFGRCTTSQRSWGGGGQDPALPAEF